MCNGCFVRPRLFAFVCLCALPGLGKDAREELKDRVAEYVKLRKGAVAGLPKLKSKAEPEEIAAHKRAEAQAIRAARANARQGDVLTPAVQEYLKQVIRSEMKGKAGLPARKAARQGNPAVEGPARVAVKVNATYPESAPLSTVPPTLLLRLPELPKEVDFRFVGRDLVLHDVNAGLIVDFVANATP